MLPPSSFCTTKVSAASLHEAVPPPQRDPCTSVRFLTAVSFDLVQLEVAASGLVFLCCRRLCWEVGHMGVHVLWSLPSLAPLPCPSRHSPVCDPSHGWLAGCQQALLQEPEVGSEHVRACADREHCCLWRDHGWQTSRGSVSRAGSPRPRLFVLRGAVVGLGGIHTRRVRSTAPRLSVMGANMRIAWCASALHMSCTPSVVSCSARMSRHGSLSPVGH